MEIKIIRKEKIKLLLPLNWASFSLKRKKDYLNNIINKAVK